MSAREAIATGWNGVYSYRKVTAEQQAAIDSLLADFNYAEVLNEVRITEIEPTT